MSELQIEYKNISDLSAYENNTRTHSDEQVQQVAASIREFGFTNPLLIRGNGQIIAGHGRLQAAQQVGMESLPCVVLDHLSDDQARALVIADNQLALNAGWDEALLTNELNALNSAGFEIGLLGFNSDDLDAYLSAGEQENTGLTDEDAVPEIQADAVTVNGDLWLLDDHRVMCGDSTIAADVARLMAGEIAHLLHADPPYGMGKENDGIKNDNIYSDKLDRFNMDWWSSFLPSLRENASAYIWGLAPVLWRLWFSGLHAGDQRLTLRQELVWNKNTAQGQSSPNLRSFPSATERCLFFCLGEQGFNENADNYWHGWEPIRKYLHDQRLAAGWDVPAMKTAVCHSDKNRDHWTSTSQWKMPTRAVYEKLQAASGGYFKKTYDELKAQYDELKADFYKTRFYFDNTHNNMTDVWSFPIVAGKERHGHATPKPVAMMERIMLSSCPPSGLVVEPFGGSGTTLIACEKTGRICYMMELCEKYCDVIVRRWQDYTGKQAVRESDGLTFDEVAARGG